MGSISCISELVLSIDVVFKSLSSTIWFVIEVITIGGCLPRFPGSYCSGSLRVHVSSSEGCEEVAS
jgi:hypothetical protein